jgi:hypothetical protein
VGTHQDDCEEDATTQEDPSSDGCEPDAAGSMLEDLPSSNAALLDPLSNACQQDTTGGMLEDLLSRYMLEELLSDGWEWDADSMPEDLCMGQDGLQWSGGVMVESQGVEY